MLSPVEEASVGMPGPDGRVIVPECLASEEGRSVAGQSCTRSSVYRQQRPAWHCRRMGWGSSCTLGTLRKAKLQSEIGIRLSLTLPLESEEKKRKRSKLRINVCIYIKRRKRLRPNC